MVAVYIAKANLSTQAYISTKNVACHIPFFPKRKKFIGSSFYSVGFVICRKELRISHESRLDEFAVMMMGYLAVANIPPVFRTLKKPLIATDKFVFFTLNGQ